MLNRAQLNRCRNQRQHPRKKPRRYRPPRRRRRVCRNSCPNPRLFRCNRPRLHFRLISFRKGPNQSLRGFRPQTRLPLSSKRRTEYGFARFVPLRSVTRSRSICCGGPCLKRPRRANASICALTIRQCVARCGSWSRGSNQRSMPSRLGTLRVCRNSSYGPRSRYETFAAMKLHRQPKTPIDRYPA